MPDRIVTIRLNGATYGEADLTDLHELRIDVNSRDWTVRCRDCRNPIVEYPDGWYDADDSPSCGGLEHDGTIRPHQPDDDRAPLNWCQRALIIPDTPGDSITARIDLDGAAFCLTIRRHPDGAFTLHLPHPDHASARKLIEQAPGVYQIHE